MTSTTSTGIVASLVKGCFGRAVRIGCEQRAHGKGLARRIILFHLPGCLAMLCFFAPLADAQLFHGVSMSKSPVGPDGTPRAHVGDMITATITVMNQDDFLDTDTISNVVNRVSHASNLISSPNLVAKPVRLDSFLLFGGTNTLEVIHQYPVLPGDETLPSSILHDQAQAIGSDNHDGPAGSKVPQGFVLTFPGEIFVVQPCLQVLRACAPLTNGTINYIGSVSNCGNTLLTNLVVSNFFNGAFAKILGPTNLAPNQGLTFTNNLRPADPNQLATDTLMAWGTDELRLTISNSASSTCSLTTTNPIVSPRMINLSRSGNTFGFSFLSQTGLTYVVEAKNSLTSTNWAPVRTNAGTGNSIPVTETTPQTSQRFYRLKVR